MFFRAYLDFYWHPIFCNIFLLKYIYHMISCSGCLTSQLSMLLLLFRCHCAIYSSNNLSNDNAIKMMWKYKNRLPSKVPPFTWMELYALYSTSCASRAQSTEHERDAAYLADIAAHCAAKDPDISFGSSYQQKKRAKRENILILQLQNGQKLYCWMCK